MMNFAADVSFRQIPGFPGYRVGSDGSVWSQIKGNGDPRSIGVLTGEWRPKRPSISRYCNVSLFCGDGRRRTMGVHRAVLEAFVGPCPEGMQALHRNGNKHDNRLENLRWGTAIQNADDRRRHGSTARGARQGLAKLTEADVLRMREMAAGGVTYTGIASTFGVSRPTARRACSGETWAHVPMAML